MGTGKFAETGRSVGELRTRTPGLPQYNWCRVAHRAPRRPRAPGQWRPGTPKIHAVGEGHAPRGHGHGVPPTPAEPRPLADPSSEGKGRRARKGGGPRRLCAPAVGAGKDVGAASPAPRPSIPASAPCCRALPRDGMGREERSGRGARTRLAQSWTWGWRRTGTGEAPTKGCRGIAYVWVGAGRADDPRPLSVPISVPAGRPRPAPAALAPPHGPPPPPRPPATAHSEVSCAERGRAPGLARSLSGLAAPPARACGPRPPRRAFSGFPHRDTVAAAGRAGARASARAGAGWAGGAGRGGGTGPAPGSGLGPQ